MRALVELTRVRLLLFLREPEALFWVFVFPLVLAGILGWAFRDGSSEPSRLGLLPEAEALAERLDGVEGFELVRFEDAERARASLTSGGVDALVHGGDPPAVQLDHQRPEAETVRLRLLAALDPDPDAASRLAVDAVTETGSRYVDYLVPGLLGMNLMGTGMWGIGFAIADLRRRKFLRRLMVTPMRRSSFFASFIFSRLVFLVLEVVVLTSFAAWILGVPFRGDVVSFAAITVLGAMSFAGLGILTVARVRTIEGASGLMNFVMMPMWLASGVFFSYERFPDALHPVLRLLPLTALNDALRAIMLDGQSVLTQGPEVAVVAAWCVITFVVALRIFRWE